MFHPTSASVVIIHSIEYFIIVWLSPHKKKAQMKQGENQNETLLVSNHSNIFCQDFIFKILQKIYLTNAAFPSRKFFL